MVTKIKAGQADALRKTLEALNSPAREQTRRDALQDIGTIHDARHAIFDNDTRFLFASVFDGSWDTYIDDFATTSIADVFSEVFTFSEGFPGISDPNVKDWFVAHQVPAISFTSAYPDLTTKQVWKDQRVNEAFQAVLDSPEFREILDNPASAALRATPAFQKLLDEAAS
ncbi:MAG: hypothetical protein K0R41_4172 [Geminicoccaceae bacterium]|nr:hypothetical protein [Geminicoccaceae bacterium]